MDKVFLSHFSIKKLAHKNMDFEFLTIIHREAFTNGKLKLNDGLTNFNFVSQETSIGITETGQALKSKKSGYILFPKYPKRDELNVAIAPLPGEIFVIADQIKEHPLTWKEPKL